MYLAWSEPLLEQCCSRAAQLRSLAGRHVEAAEDLLQLVARAPRLQALFTFGCVEVDLRGGEVSLSIEEVRMHVTPISPDGKAIPVVGSVPHEQLSDTDSLLVRDLQIQGRSILRLAS